MYKQTLSIFIILFLFSSPVVTSDISFEGESDWTMYQYNGQHTGYNDKDKIDLPLELKWSRRYQVDSFEFNPPIIIGERIVVTNRRKNIIIEDIMSVRCIDLNSGNLNWEHGYGGIHTLDPPIYYDSIVYFQYVDAGGQLFAYNLLEGNFLWRLPYYAQKNKHFGSVISNNTILFMSGSYGGLTTANAKTGEFLWWKRFGDYNLQAPAVYDNKFYVWSSGQVSVWTVDTQELVWFHSTWIPTPPNIGGGPAIDTTDQIVFLGHQNYVFAVDMTTHELLWKNYHPYPSSLSANFVIPEQGLTPSICNDRLYYINQDSLYCCDKFTGESLWKYGTDNKFWSPPVIANGLLFVATRDSTFAFDLATEEKVWEFPVGGQIAVGNNHLVLGSIEGELYVFGRVQTDIDDNVTNNLPTGYELHQNYPNPFNPSTTIEFSLPQKSFITIDIINIAGQKIRTLTNQQYTVGTCQ